MTDEAARARTDTLRSLRAFLQVARLGSVSRAASLLGLSQPAVTLQLQALAREHGVALLERSGRRLVPTPAGEALLDLARPLVDGFDGLAEALQVRLRAQDDDGLAIAAGRVALRRLLPGAAAAWTARMPGVPLHVRSAGGEAALALLRAGDVAFAVGSWLDLAADIDFEPLLESPARLLVPRDHPLAAGADPSPRELAGQVLVLPADRGGTRQLVDLAFARAGVPMPAVHEARDWDDARALVALGQGVAITTRLALDLPDPAGPVVRPLPDVFPARPYGIATRRGRPLSGHAARFTALLRTTLPAFED